MAKQILVVDANREFGILIRQSLEEDAEYNAVLVHSGQQAIEAASQQTFEAALIDFGLPDIPGADVVNQLKQINPEISVVAIPVAGNTEEVDGLQISGVLTKPFYLPDLPRILNKALTERSFNSNWIQWQQPERKKPPQISEPVASSASTAEPEVQAETKAKVNQESAAVSISPSQDEFEAAVERIQAQAGMIWDGNQSERQAGLTRDQASQLIATLRKLHDQIQRKRAVTQYLQLPDRDGDSLLYASPWRSGLTLVVLYPAAASFRQVRRGVKELEDLLNNQSEESAPTQAGVAVEPTTPQAPETDQAELPQDWVPETEFSPAQRALLEELASIEPPPPDPAPSHSKPPAQEAAPELPDDWIPSSQRSEAVLAMIEESEEKSAETPAEPGQLETSFEQLTYSLVLLPRFPEHRFHGSLAAALPQWIERICLAWDWNALQVLVEESFIRLQLKLNADSAPAQAVQQLKADLARRILNERTEWNAVLPSGRFFARRHLLTAGEPPEASQIQAFIRQVRQDQGLGR